MPFPTEQNEDFDHEALREIGVTTGRKRRIGFLDLPMVKRSCELNGVDYLALTKLDALDKDDKIKICIGYKYQEKTIMFPDKIADLENLEPIYEEMEGWKCGTSGIREFKNLPENAKKYVNRITEILGVDIALISVGPDREQTIWMGSIFE